MSGIATPRSLARMSEQICRAPFHFAKRKSPDDEPLNSCGRNAWIETARQIPASVAWRISAGLKWEFVTINLPRPKTGISGLAHQVAQFVGTIEIVGVPVVARLLCPQLKLLGVHLEQAHEIVAGRGFSRLICRLAHGHLPS